jgi:hypothetical protein
MSEALAETHDSVAQTAASDTHRHTRRYCRHCDKFLDITDFPIGPRRYVCRMHMYQRVKVPARLRVQADDKRCSLSKLWDRCRTDSKALGQTRIQLSQREIAEILKDKGIDLANAIVPAKPSTVLSSENFVVVPNEFRRPLIWAHKLGGESLYLSTLAVLQCVDSPAQQSTTDTQL